MDPSLQDCTIFAATIPPNVIEAIQANPDILDMLSSIVACALTKTYSVTRGVDPDSSFFHITRGPFTEEQFLLVTDALKSAPELFRRVAEQPMANFRDYYIKYITNLYYVYRALNIHGQSPETIFNAIFDALDDYFDVWPLSPTGLVESTSDYIFADSHAVVDDIEDALPENYIAVDATLESDKLTRAISFLNSMTLKLKEEGLEIPKDEDRLIQALNFTDKANQLKSQILTQKSTQAPQSGSEESPVNERQAPLPPAPPLNYWKLAGILTLVAGTALVTSHFLRIKAKENQI